MLTADLVYVGAPGVVSTAFAGITFDFAGLLVTPFDFTTNPVGVTLVP